MTDMRFIKSVRNDWKLAVHRQWKALLILVCMSVIFCVDFRLLLAEAYANHPYIPNTADYLFYIFGGMEEYVPSKVEAFLFPSIWICINGLILFLSLRYPVEGLYENGQQILIRTGGRLRYWVSKCVLLVLENLFYIFICYGTISLVSILTKGKIFAKPKIGWISEFGKIDLAENISQGIPVWIYLAPFCMLLFLASIQMIVSLFLGSSLTFTLMLGLLVASAYIKSPYLVGNLGMFYRSAWAAENGIETGSYMAVVLGLCAALWIVGGIIFCRMDLLKREELG